MNLALESERLSLQVLFEESAPAVAQFYQRNIAFLEQWEPNAVPALCEDEFARKWLHYEFAQMEQGQFIRYWYSLKGCPQVLCGSVCFQHITWNSFCTCEIGYKQDIGFSGRGLATEAVTAAILHLFRDCSLHRIEAHIETTNQPSVHLAERIGFEREGLARKAVFMRGDWRDCYSYALLNDFRKK